MSLKIIELLHTTIFTDTDYPDIIHSEICLSTALRCNIGEILCADEVMNVRRKDPSWYAHVSCTTADGVNILP